MKNLKNLEDLYLYSNELFELDAQGIVNSLPRLKRIYLVDNNFKCDDLKDYIKIFEANNIERHLHYLPEYERKREYIPERIDGIHCLNSLQFNRELSNKKTSFQYSIWHQTISQIENTLNETKLDNNKTHEATLNYIENMKLTNLSLIHI